MGNQYISPASWDRPVIDNDDHIPIEFDSLERLPPVEGAWMCTYSNCIYQHEVKGIEWIQGQAHGAYSPFVKTKDGLVEIKPYQWISEDGEFFKVHDNLKWSVANDNS